MIIINSLPVFSFMASLGAMAGKDLTLLPSPPETLLSIVEGGRSWGMGDNTAIPPLFRPRVDGHKIVPLELLSAKPTTPFEEGARVYVEASVDSHHPYEAVEEDVMVAAGGWFWRLFRRRDSVREFFGEVDRKIRAGDDNYFSTGSFREKINTLTSHQCSELAPRIETRLGDGDAAVRSTAVNVLSAITPHLSDSDRRGLERLREGKGGSVGAISRILKQLTKHNRDQVVNLLQTAVSEIEFLGRELPVTLHFWADIFGQWSRLGFPVLEGLVEGIQKGIVSKAPEGEERTLILKFIGVTHGFVPAVYAAYKRKGEGVLTEIQNYVEKILSEEMGVKDLRAIATAHEADGGMEFVLAVIQTVSPTSGASFVKRDQQVCLLEKMLGAGDRRGDIPEIWRKVVKTFELEHGSWQLKEGEVADPEGKIIALLKQFRAGEGEKVGEAAAVEGLKAYLKSERKEKDLEHVREVLFAYAGS